MIWNLNRTGNGGRSVRFCKYFWDDWLDEEGESCWRADMERKQRRQNEPGLERDSARLSQSTAELIANMTA